MDIARAINYNARSAFKREPDGFGKSATEGRIAGVAQG
jgi:hypothetical protein